MDFDKAIQTQIENIQKKTGKTLDQLYAWLKKSGLAKVLSTCCHRGE